jgi:hypothetical protein
LADLNGWNSFIRSTGLLDYHLLPPGWQTIPFLPHLADHFPVHHGWLEVSSSAHIKGWKVYLTLTWLAEFISPAHDFPKISLPLT